ncbi:MAG: ORC1-type DNA replication protein [Candidatus Bathyarchaeia archaeon]
MRESRSVFKDERVLDINYVPEELLHREEELRFLETLYDFMIKTPHEMSQRVVIMGGVGTGKTALAQRFGMNLVDRGRDRGVDIKYVHVNCRELRGSLFMVLRRVVKTLRPEFPERGYAASELLEILLQILDEEDTQLLLCLDEVDSLIKQEGGDSLYHLTRFQERRPDGPRRLSLIVISKDGEAFKEVDRSTLSSLQRNIIKMSDYTQPELADIVLSRAERGFHPEAISLDVIDFISELASTERGDARYAIDLLWRAGKYADVSYSREVLPEHVRKAAATLFPVLKEESVRQLSLHEQLALLGIARHFLHNKATHASTGEIERSYHVVCEEYDEEPRKHTQFWKYLKKLKALDAINIKLSMSSEGRTQLISLAKVPSEELEKEVKRIIEQG